MTIIWNTQIHTFILHDPQKHNRLETLHTWIDRLATNSIHVVNNLDIPDFNNIQKGAFGIAHILHNAIQTRLFKNGQKVLIIEDDVIPYETIEEVNAVLIRGVVVPDTLDALYFGCSHFRVHHTEDTHIIGPSYTAFDDKISRIWNMLGTHAILINTEVFAYNYLYSMLTSIALKVQYDIGLARTLANFEVYGFNKPLFVQLQQVGGQEHQTRLELWHHPEKKELSTKKLFANYIFQELQYNTIKSIYVQNVVYVPIDIKNIHHAATVAAIFYQVHTTKISDVRFIFLTNFDILESDFLSVIQQILPSEYNQRVKEWLFNNTHTINLQNDYTWKEFIQVYVHAHSAPIDIIQSHFYKLFMVHYFLYYCKNDMTDTHSFTILNPFSTFQHLPLSFITEKIISDQFIFCTPSHGPFILQKLNKTGLRRVIEIILTSYREKTIKQCILDISQEMRNRNEEGGIDLFTFFDWIHQNAWNFSEGFKIHKIQIPDIKNRCMQHIEEARIYILGTSIVDIPKKALNDERRVAEQNKELVDPIIIRPHFLGGKHTDIDKIYILQCLEAIKHFHQHAEQSILCIVNDRDQLIQSGNNLNGSSMVQHIENFVNYETRDYHNFLKNYIHLSSNYELFEKYSIAGYFLIREIMHRNSWERAWIIETDTLLLCSLIDVQTMLTPPKNGMSYITNGCTCCVAWVSYETIVKYCDVVIESYMNDVIKQCMFDIYIDMRVKKRDGGINDMTFWDWIKRDCWGLNGGILLNNIDIKLPDGSFFDYMIQETSCEYLDKRGFHNQEFIKSQFGAYINNELEIFKTKKLILKHGKIMGVFSNNEETCLIRSLQFQGHYKWLMIAFWNTIRKQMGISQNVPYSETTYTLLPVQL